MLKWGAAGAIATLFPTVVASPSVAAGTPRFAGHRPGSLYVGVSSARKTLADDVRAVGQMGLKRTFHGWTGFSSERSKITAAHQASILPWVSFASVGAANGGFAAIARGKFDADIRARARHYASFSKPVITTFCHEPHNKMEGTRADWANAFIRIHQVMASETGLKNVIYAPIIGEWEFNPVNKNGNPRGFLPDEALGRCDFLGTDIYQPPTTKRASDKLAVIFSFMDRYGFGSLPMGIGETGVCNTLPGRAADWFDDMWAFTQQNRQRMVAMAYFDQNRNNNRPGTYWPLDQSWDKKAAFQAAVASPIAIRLGEKAAPEPEPEPEPTPSSGEIRVSTKADRSGATALDGRTVRGAVFVFVPESANIKRVVFWIDSTSGSPVSTENMAPFDLAGTKWDGGRNLLAKPFYTGRLSNGAHSVIADVTNKDGSTRRVTARFTVAN